MFVIQDPVTKKIELDTLQTFALNILSHCKQNHVSLNKACKQAKISNARIYEMRSRTFERFISFYTLCALSVFVGGDIVELLTPQPEVGASPQQAERKIYKK